MSNSDPTKMTLVEWIRWRIRNELRQGRQKKEIAKSLGVSPKTLYRYRKSVNMTDGDNSHE